LRPALGGAFLGWLLALAFRETPWDRRRYFFLLAFILFPLGAHAVERQFPAECAVAEIDTSLVFGASAAHSWNSILFYEQVDHSPPWLLKLALPQPVCAVGSKSAPGDTERCVYRKGYLVKEISQVQEQRLLAFRVVEQHLHFERDVTLLDGAFLLEPIDEGHTRVVLSTRYVRHLRPAWLWEPMERKIVHTLHGHVLEGMRRRLPPGEGFNGFPYPDASPKKQEEAKAISAIVVASDPVQP
jgi:hypothetical protein